MKFIDGDVPTIELTRRNLTVLLAKLDEPGSQRMLLTSKSGFYVAAVHAVEDDEHYSDREPGVMEINGEVI